MADIFISYSNLDRLRVETLSAMLETEGWSVWFDRSLKAGDDFRDEISEQLARARVVVVLWTEASCKSTWVRSEAGRAMADRKLVPVKLAHIAYKDLPQPFDVLHTEDLDNAPEIKAAIVAQLTKPTVAPSGLWLASAEFRYQLLTWVGIVGGALTLFSGFGALLQLASWAQWLVSHWQALSFGFWRTVGALVGVSVSQAWVPLLSLLAFVLSVAIGQRLALAARGKEAGLLMATSSKRVAQIAFAASLSMGVSIVWFSLLWRIGLWSEPPNRPLVPPAELFNRDPVLQWFALTTFPLGDAYLSALRALKPAWLSVVVSAVVVLSPFAATVCASRTRLPALLVVCVAILMTLAIALGPMIQVGSGLGPLDSDALLLPGAIASALIWLLPLIMLAIAPTRALARRLVFLAIGVALLLGLNELSKLGLDPRAPRG